MSLYFSNGTEGRAWEAEWCNRCTEDHGMHVGQDDPPGCLIFTNHVVSPDEPVNEWIDQCEDAWRHLPRRMSCVMFSLCKACHPDEGPHERKPPKPIPGQEVMFDVPEHTLIYRDTIIDTFGVEVEA